MQKIKNSFSGIIIGIIFIIVGGILLFWNEKNNVENLKTTKEIREIVVDISSESVNSSSENKLVSVNGKLDILNSKITDPVFNISIPTAKLKRVVEMYQWQENCSDSDDNSTCTYSLKWSEQLINSSNFKNINGHTNPTSMPYESETRVLNNAKVGAFYLSKEQLNKLPLDETYLLSNNIFGYTIQNNYYTTSENISNPKVGDIRIYFKYNVSENITVLAMQSGEYLIDYISDAGKTVNEVQDGIKTSDEMIDIMENNNKMWKWLLRGIGFLLEIFGFALLLGPITTLTSYVPILGSLVGTATSLISFVFGSAVALTCIGVAWLLYRPVIGIVFIIVAAALLCLLFNKRNRPKPINNAYYNNQAQTSAVSNKKYCIHCGTVNDINSSFCIKCGKEM